MLERWEYLNIQCFYIYGKQSPYHGWHFIQLKIESECTQFWKILTSSFKVTKSRRLVGESNFISSYCTTDELLKAIYF